MTAPVGSNVGLYYDSEQAVNPGDFLQTPTGRTYYVTEARTQQRGEYAGIRRHLRAIVTTEDAVEADAVVHPLFWYKRDKSR